MAEEYRRRTTYRSFRFVRPTRVVRSPDETVAVWRPRVRQYAVAAAGWLVVAVVFAVTGGGGLVVGMSSAAALLSALVAVKGVVLVSRNRGAAE